MCFVKRDTYEGGVSLIKSARACREIEGGGDGRRLSVVRRARARAALSRVRAVCWFVLPHRSLRRPHTHSRGHARAGVRERGRQGRAISLNNKACGPQLAVAPHHAVEVLGGTRSVLYDVHTSVYIVLNTTSVSSAHVLILGAALSRGPSSSSASSIRGVDPARPRPLSSSNRADPEWRAGPYGGSAGPAQAI